MTRPPVRLATDIGGTFTDIVLDTGTRRLTTKVLTTPRAPEQAVVEGTKVVLQQANLTFADIDVFVHGTTLATNAIIERKGAKTALIATDGFRDVIEIADEGRFDQYDLYIRKPTPLVPRRLRFTVAERLDVEGIVRRPLDEAAVRTVAQQLIIEGIESVAIALIHAYTNDAHERRIAAILAEAAPKIAVTLSSEVCPEAREYERTITAICNAYVQPLMAGYLGRLKATFAADGYKHPIHLMTSGGSLAALETAARFPIRLVESGPAGGAILAAEIAAERGEHRIVSFDMGGTTAKLCLIDDGRPMMARTFEIDRQSRFMKGSGFPVRIPVIEMVEIGAGGGSIAHVDVLKRVVVGPESAGSEPGPACYGRGGTKPAVTDADVTLGKIDPTRFAGGRIVLDMDAAARALVAAVGTPLGLDAVASALAVSEIVDENMANAARVHAVERGAAVTERTLIAFGGAAPLHASRIAEKLGITRIVVPADADVGSAVGFLTAPAAYELIRSRYMRLDAFDVAAANALLGDMGSDARAFAASAAGGRAISETRSAYMRYAGQGHEISVPLPERAVTAADAERLRAAFETAYRALFARHIPGAAIEIMSWVVVASTSQAKPARLPLAPPVSEKPKLLGTRTVVDPCTAQSVTAAIHAREDLAPGMSVPGPCLIVEPGTSTYVSPTFSCSVDAGHALILTT